MFLSTNTDPFGFTMKSSHNSSYFDRQSQYSGALDVDSKIDTNFVMWGYFALFMVLAIGVTTSFLLVPVLPLFLATGLGVVAGFSATAGIFFLGYQIKKGLSSLFGKSKPKVTTVEGDPSKTTTEQINVALSTTPSIQKAPPSPLKNVTQPKIRDCGLRLVGATQKRDPSVIKAEARTDAETRTIGSRV